MTAGGIEQSGMEIIRDETGIYRLRDTMTGLWRSIDPLWSHYAWVQERRAAARFRSRYNAAAVERAYATGIDLSSELAIAGASAREILTGDPIVRLKEHAAALAEEAEDAE